MQVYCIYQRYEHKIPVLHDNHKILNMQCDSSKNDNFRNVFSIQKKHCIFFIFFRIYLSMLKRTKIRKVILYCNPMNVSVNIIFRVKELPHLVELLIKKRLHTKNDLYFHKFMEIFPCFTFLK